MVEIIADDVSNTINNLGKLLAAKDPRVTYCTGSLHISGYGTQEVWLTMDWSMGRGAPVYIDGRQSVRFQCATFGQCIDQYAAWLAKYQPPDLAAVLGLNEDGSTRPEAMRYPETFCSNCGKGFGPGEHGYSHCDSHAGKRAVSR